jgi:hypothetical protein
MLKSLSTVESIEPTKSKKEREKEMENEWLVTPRRVLGSDSFTVFAPSYHEAVRAAKRRIHREDWSCADGWEIYRKYENFDQGF